MKQAPFFMGAFAGCICAAIAIAASYFLLVPRLFEHQWDIPLYTHWLLHDRYMYSALLKRVADTDTTLVLGTSESGNLVSNGPNFPEILRDKLKGKLVVLRGAERTPYTWMDWACRVRHRLDYPKRTYMIVNPIYFQDWLNNASKVPGLSHFISREQGDGLADCISQLPLVATSAAERQSVLDAIRDRPLIGSGFLFHERVHASSKALRDTMKRWFGFISSDPAPRWTAPEWWIVIDDKLNVGEFFKGRSVATRFKTSRVLSDENSPRFVELKLMRDFVDHVQMPITFVLLPYNKDYFSAVKPDEVENFERAIANVRRLLCQTTRCVDLSGLSEQRGLFADFAHFSDAGARAIADGIANHLDGNH